MQVLIGVMLLLFLCFSFSLLAADIKGKVIDAQTGEPLVGGVITLEGPDHARTTVVRLDGSYGLQKYRVS